MCSCYDLSSGGSNTVTMSNVTSDGTVAAISSATSPRPRVRYVVRSVDGARFPVIHYRCHTSGILAQRPSVVFVIRRLSYDRHDDSEFLLFVQTELVYRYLHCLPESLFAVIAECLNERSLGTTKWIYTWFTRNEVDRSRIDASPIASRLETRGSDQGFRGGRYRSISIRKILLFRVRSDRIAAGSNPTGIVRTWTGTAGNI